MLSDAKIRAAKPKAKAYKLADAGGLYLLIRPTGSRTWRLKYRFAQKEKTLTIGEYPIISLKEARDKRDWAKGHLIEGADPSVVQRQERVANTSSEHTFEGVARDWHERNAGMWTEKNAAAVLRRLESDLFPAIGNTPVAKVTAMQLLSALESVQKRGAVETAHRLRNFTSRIFAFAIARKKADRNPADEIKGALNPVRAGKMPSLGSIEEVRGVLRTAESPENPCRPQTALALRFLALTVMRSSEVRKALASQMEGLEGAEPLWRVPASQMKMDRDFLVPLSRQAAETAKVAISLAGPEGVLFPNSRFINRPMSENALGYHLNRCGYSGRHTPHGFRSSFSTIMNERYPAEDRVIDFMLAHKPRGKIEAAYNRALYLDRRRELGQIWADMLLEGAGHPEELLLLSRKRFAGHSL